VIQSASLLENTRFNALVIVPNAVQGIFRRRPAAVAAATRANVDGWAVGLLEGMRRGHAGGPVWVRVIRDRALLLLTPADVHRALEGSPDPFASDPKPKRDGMVAFQPDALTISRGELWRSRRDFTEAVLDTGRSHRFAERFVAVAREEAAALATAIEWQPWSLAFRRITRRVVLGDAARDDETLTDELAAMMSQANGMPGETSDRYTGFVSRVVEYVSTAEEGSLVSLFAEASADGETSPVGQIPHWLFATGDTLALNSLRALALIAAHPRQRGEATAEAASDGHELPYLRGCLEEAMRLYPTTPMLSRVTLGETDWGGETVASGTQVLIPNTFLHRDRERFEYADRFAPERWTEGDAPEQWSFNHFSRGPQVCPGIELATLLGTTVLASVLRQRSVELESPSIDPEKALPHMLDPYSVRVLPH
jgi:cytochrome P450